MDEMSNRLYLFGEKINGASTDDPSMGLGADVVIELVNGFTDIHMTYSSTLATSKNFGADKNVSNSYEILSSGEVLITSRQRLVSDFSRVVALEISYAAGQWIKVCGQPFTPPAMSETE